MRLVYSIIFSVLVVALSVATIIAYHSKKSIGKTVALLLFSLIPPVTGNLFIIVASNEVFAKIGCYIYFLGMDLVMLCLSYFTLRYCDIKLKNKLIQIIIITLLLGDFIQLCLNPAFSHAFTMKSFEFEGALYYGFNALAGQSVHRLIDYSVLGFNFVVIIVKAIRSPKFYSEKYWVILIVMIVVTAWETFYIFSSTPIDRSMTGFAAYGLSVFYFSLYYRPLRLLDRMLASIASRMSECLYFFDTSKRCIWANNEGLKLAGMSDTKSLENLKESLFAKFGHFEKEGSEWTTTVSCGEGYDFESYIIEKHVVIDDRDRDVGIVLTIRNNTDEQKILQKETYNATHDSLTGVLNRAGYNTIIERIDFNKCFFVLTDIDNFKTINDTYGHEMGDEVLINMVETFKKYFRGEDCICRLGGDEFAIFLENVSEDMAKKVEERVNKINEELSHPKGDLVPCTISAGGVFGHDVENTYELYKKADHALYRKKFSGKSGFMLYKKD